MDYRINLGAWRKVFAVPSCVADYLKIASGDQVKVLLYLLANADLGLRSQDIADALGITEGDVDDALMFWTQNAKIISGIGGELVPSDVVHTAAAPVRRQPMLTPEAKAALTAETQFPPKEIAQAVNDSKAVRYLFELYEKLAGRPTKHAERNTLMIITDEIGLPAEVAAMLVEYCFSVEKATPAYMKSVALDWCESEIDTIGKAEERINVLRRNLSFENMMKRKFGLTSAFSAKQKKIIEKWAQMSLSEPLIDEAYDSMIRHTGGINLPYMDTILCGWANDGITDPSQLRKNKKASAADSGSGESSFSISELEELSYSRYKTD